MTGRARRFLRYGISSVAATLASALAFALLYRLIEAGPRVASVAAFAAGACVNFAGNRFWAWSRRHRLGLGRDMVSYAVLAIATALAAVGVTSLAEAYARHAALGTDTRAVVVEAAYFATYAVMFLVKFVVLDRVVFAQSTGTRRPAADPPATAVATASRHQVDRTTRA